MGRIIYLDIGGKRTGVAVTDPLRIIASGLATIEAKELLTFLKSYLTKEQVDLILVGLPLNLDGSETHGTSIARTAINNLKKNLPDIPIETLDERFTSRMAKNAMLEMGLKKKDRAKKENVDMVSAVLILQTYLQQKELRG